MPIPKTLTYIRTGIIILVFLGVAFLANMIIYMAAESAWPLYMGVPHLGLQIALAVLSIGAIVFIALSSHFNNAFMRVMYAIFSVWMGLFVYLFLGAFVYGVIEEVVGMLGATISLSALGGTILSAALLIVIGGYINSWPIRSKHIKVSLQNLPDFWKGKKAVFVSDIHLGQIHTAKFASRVVSAVNEHKPDIVLIGGDLYDGVKVDEQAIITPFKDMKPVHGTYFVTGNHEEFADSSHFLNAIRAAGIRVLMNELVDVNGLQIVGVTDHDSVDKDKLVSILAGLNIDRSRASIFLKHQPSHLEIPEAAGLSFQLSGHTHRAQMFPMNCIPYWIYKGYSYGLKRFKNMQIYTSSGVGSWGPSLRVGSSTEIVVIEFV